MVVFLRKFLFAGLLGVLFVAFSGGVEARPAFSAFAVDAHTGEVLFDQQGTALRYPASLTKMMTLYLLFQDLEMRRVSLATQLRVSVYGASQAPSKLGLKPGSTIRVEDAILALVVKSANDVAVTVAENLGGTEAAFAQRMTRTAQLLGMERTHFYNASGLPHPDQLTTARDMAILGLRLQRDFPQYYKYFATKSFFYNNKKIMTHNHLLRKFSGIDGIKTGYTAASGFNLVASLSVGDGKRLLGVVFGGVSNQARNTYMLAMLKKASERAQSGSGIAKLPRGGGRVPALTTEQIARYAEPSHLVSSPIVKKSDSLFAIREGQAEITGAKVLTPPRLTHRTSKKKKNSREQSQQKCLPFAVKMSHSRKRNASHCEPQNESLSLDQADHAPQAETSTEGWSVQIGAFPSEENAQRKLTEARRVGAAVLNGKNTLTLPSRRKGRAVYRARFSGFASQKKAQAACLFLKRKGIHCLALKNSP